MREREREMREREMRETRDESRSSGHQRGRDKTGAWSLHPVFLFPFLLRPLVFIFRLQGVQDYQNPDGP